MSYPFYFTVSSILLLPQPIFEKELKRVLCSKDVLLLVYRKNLVWTIQLCMEECFEAR